MAEAGDWKAPDESEAQQQFPEQGPQCTRSPGIKNEPGGGRGGEEGARCMHTQPRPGPGGLQSPAATWLRGGTGGRKKKKRKKKALTPPSPPSEPGGVSPTSHTRTPPVSLPPPGAGQGVPLPSPCRSSWCRGGGEEGGGAAPLRPAAPGLCVIPRRGGGSADTEVIAAGAARGSAPRSPRSPARPAELSLQHRAARAGWRLRCGRRPTGPDCSASFCRRGAS